MLYWSKKGVLSMKKLILLVALLVALCLLGGCSLQECDICGELGFCEEGTIGDYPVAACGDCREATEEMQREVMRDYLDGYRDMIYD